MRTVTYTGPHGGGVDVQLPNGGVITVSKGGVVSVTDDFAERLLEQSGNWQLAAAPSVAKKKETKR